MCALKVLEIRADRLAAMVSHGGDANSGPGQHPGQQTVDLPSSARVLWIQLIENQKLIDTTPDWMFEVLRLDSRTRHWQDTGWRCLVGFKDQQTDDHVVLVA